MWYSHHSITVFLVLLKLVRYSFKIHYPFNLLIQPKLITTKLPSFLSNRTEVLASVSSGHWRICLAVLNSILQWSTIKKPNYPTFNIHRQRLPRKQILDIKLHHCYYRKSITINLNSSLNSYYYNKYKKISIPLLQCSFPIWYWGDWSRFKHFI